ncbi:MAG: integral rane sensor signal transduction histidine kinase [Deltaproteobacteria bacterium]|nr:integral rane sensor signal transduction histidine kinase [Deltaproteobacteria bacterium]
MKWHKSIGVKIVLLIVGIIAITTGALVFVYLSIQKENLEAMAHRTASKLSETIGKSIQNDMLLNRKEAAYRIMDTIGQQEGIEKVRVFNAEGTILYSSYDPGEKGRMVDKRAEECFRCHQDASPVVRLATKDRSRIFLSSDSLKKPGVSHRVLGIINPLYNEPGCSGASCHAHPESQKVLGVIDVTMDMSDVDEYIARARSRVLAVGVVSILLGCLVASGILFRFIQWPVRELAEGTARIAKGDLDTVIPVGSEDELGQLARSFNQMTVSLRDANAEINALVEGLNQMVDERTAELKEAQDQLLNAEKLAHLGKIAATVAHEINNPLHGVFTYIRLMERKLQEGAPGPEQAEKFRGYLSTMAREVERTSAIVFNLLDFTRPKDPLRQRVDLRKLIEESLVLVQNLVKSNNVEVRQELSPIPETDSDPAQMKQVFLNLLVNACEAMESGGTLTIRCWENPRPRTVVVEVGDTGSGISQEHLRKIFDPFFTTKGKGTGIGLSVVRGIVGRHGGKIEVDSEENRGTRFRIVLPLG